MRNELQRRRQQVNPRTLKKRSDIAGHKEAPSRVAGKRVPTDTGYKVETYSGDGFTTYYEMMLAGTTSPRLHHDKKERVLYILGGQGYLYLTQGKLTEERRLIPGDQVILHKGCVYKLATTSNQNLELLVSEDAKYTSRVKVIEESDALRKPTESDLKEPTQFERESGLPGIRPRRGSKAVVQQKIKQGGRVSKQIELQQQVVQEKTTAPPERAGTPTSVNAQPSGGKFDDAGAG
jgi:mannose-6-phosphate isomerase-like protein (cupin superfamily)